MITFDGAKYQFGGEGFFWLVKSEQLSIQARFVERQDSRGDSGNSS